MSPTKFFNYKKLCFFKNKIKIPALNCPLALIDKLNLLGG